MRNSVLALAVIVLLVGLVFIGQGMGAIPGSAMTGSRFWAVVGLVMVFVAVVIAGREWQRRSRGGAR